MPKIKSNNQVIETIFKDKTYRISLDFLDKIWNKAKKLEKVPYLILGIQKNNKETYMLKCEISLEKNGSKNE